MNDAFKQAASHEAGGSAGGRASGGRARSDQTGNDRGCNDRAGTDRDRGGDAGDPAEAVSRPELEKLEAQRRNPAPLYEMTPHGMAAVKAEQDRQREERLRHLAERLDAAAGKAIDGFAKGKTQDVAKRAFDRER